MKTIPHKKIVGVGAVLADILAPVLDSFISDHGFAKGSRMQSNKPILSGLMTKLQGQYRIAPGGSVCNTIIGASQLGISTAFIAKCGQDQLGKLVCSYLETTGIETHIYVDAGLPTGTCLSLITPDGERTMLVNLAASDALMADDIPADFFVNAGVAHFEAYMASTPALMLNLLERAYDAGCVISLDLGSFSIIKTHLTFLQKITADYVDILIGNLAEGVMYTGRPQENDILVSMAQNVEIAALKKGAQGSVIYSKGQKFNIPAVVSSAEQAVMDSTGAGDVWNSGFLYALSCGMDLVAAGNLASRCGYEVCLSLGAQITPERWRLIKQNFLK